MPVNVELNALAVGEGLGEGHECLVFCRVAGGQALVSLVAGVGGGAVGEFPLVWPVAVDICSDTGLAGAGLAVLAPEAVVGLGVDEAWWVW